MLIGLEMSNTSIIKENKMDRDNKGKFLNGHKNFRQKTIKSCLVENCIKAVFASNYCGQHYQRFKKYGNPLEPMHWAGRPTTKLKFKCLNCGKDFLRPPSAIKKNSFKYCSRECAFIGAVGKQKKVPPIEESTWRINRKGYLETTRRRKRILQHRWIVETQIINRPLKAEEIIHHLNGIKTDNRKENLAICCNKTHHEFIKKLNERIRELEGQKREVLLQQKGALSMESQLYNEIERTK